MNAKKDKSGQSDFQRGKESEEILIDPTLLLQVMDTSLIYYAWQDCNSTYRGCNDKYADYIGLKKPLEIVGKHLDDFLRYPGISKQSREEDQKVIETGKPILHSIEKSQDSHGNVIWFERSKYPLWDKSGMVNGVLSVFRDITEQKMIEENLRESEKRWKYALEGAGDGVWDWNLATNQVYFSAQWCKMLGYCEEEIDASLDSWSKKVHPDDFDMVVAEIQKHIRGESPEYRSEHRLLCKDGSYKWILDRGKITDRDKDGKPLRMIGTHADITDRKKIEEDFIHSQEQYKQLTETINEIIWLWDAKTYQMLYISPQYERVFGRSCQSVYDDPNSFVESIHPDDKEWVMQRQMALIQNEVEFDVEYKIVRPSKEVRWIHARTLPVKNDAGEVIRYAGIAEDITDRKQADEALIESMLLLESFFDLALDLLCIADVDGNFLKLNRAWETTLGYPIEELLQHKFFDFIHPDDIQKTNNAVAQLTAQQPVMRFVNRYRHKDGSYRFIEWISHPHEHLVYAAARDITERMEVERVLRESEQKYKLLADNMKDVIWILDLRTQRFKYVSPSVEGLRGYTVEEVMAEPVEKSMTPESFQNVTRWIQEKFAEIAENNDIDKSVELKEVEQTCKDGSTVWTEVSSVYIVDENNMPIEVLGVSRDISDRKKAEQAQRKLYTELERKNAELERFTYTVSHDLKSPIITIKGFLGYLGEDIRTHDDDRVKSDITRIGSAADKMMQLLDDLLELSRIGRVSSHPSEIPFDGVVQDAIEILAGSISARAVEVEVMPGMPVVYGDRTRLTEAIQNLLENAIKYMGSQANPHVEIGFQKTDADIEFFVKDNGIGIDPKNKDKIFGLFEKLDPTTEGTGVGLALVKRIIENHSGKIWVESDGKGSGSKFVFTLPIIKSKK